MINIARGKKIYITHCPFFSNVSPKEAVILTRMQSSFTLDLHLQLLLPYVGVGYGDKNKLFPLGMDIKTSV